MKPSLPRSFKTALLAVCTAFCPCLVSSIQATPTEFWVSPSGNDTTGTGAELNPWLTVGKARDYIRTNSLNASMADDIIVNLAAGDYYVTSSIDFTASDSGSNGHYVIYQSVDGTGTARIHCGQLPTGWTQISMGSPIWQSSSIGAGKAIRSLYENNKIGCLARSPNAVVEDRYPMYRGDYKISTAGGNNGTNDWVQYTSGDFSPGSWTVTGAANLGWWSNEGHRNWGLVSPSLISVDAVNRKLFFTPTGVAPTSDERYFVEGVYELLDAPGEFFYDTTSGLLYYYPRDGDPNSQDIRVSRSNELINVSGSAIATHAHHLKFVGLSFAYARTGGNSGALALTFTDHVEIRDCHIYDVGESAIYLADNNSYDTIYGCWIEHCGVGGIRVDNSLQRATYPTGTSDHHLISNCKITDLGEAYTNAIRTAGVALFSTSDCEVSYCDISNSARYATSLRGHWSTQYTPNDTGLQMSKNNTFAYIRAKDCLTDSSDAGIVHAAQCNGSGDPNGAGNINYWNQILISGAYTHPTNDDVDPNGVFLDHPNSCLYQNFANIKVTFTQGAQYRTNSNATQTTSNVSWTGTFNDALMDYANIGLKSDFPAVYDDQMTVVTDDHTIDYSESDGTWSDSFVNLINKGDCRYHAYNASGSTQYAEWRPTLPLTGNYQVYTWKMSNGAALSTGARHTVYYDGGSATTNVNQQSGTGGSWVSLGTYFMLGGRNANSGYVRLFTNNSDSKAVRADAAKFVYSNDNTGQFGSEKGWWRFESNGNDISGLGHDATFPGGSAYAAGHIGSDALSLNGTSQYAAVADTADLDPGTGNLSISLWFYRVSNAATNLRLISKGAGTDSDQGYSIWASDTNVTASLGDGTTRISAAKSYSGTSAWHHLAVVIQRSGNMTVYIDGVAGTSVAVSSMSATNINSTRDLNIGRNVTGSNLYWPGRIDDVRVYKRLLSAAEIAALASP